MTWILETPMPVLALALLVELVLGVMLWKIGRGTILLMMAGTAVVAGGFVLLEWLVVTDVEQIEQTLDHAAAAVEAGDSETLLALVSTSEKADPMRLVIGTYLPKFDFTEVRITQPPTITVHRQTTPPSARAIFFAKATVHGKGRSNQALGNQVLSNLVKRLEVSLRLEDDQWRIEAYKELPLLGDQK